MAARVDYETHGVGYSRGRRAAPCLAATAESLPFDDDSVDAAMACVTIHHWPDRARGLAELRRIARGPVAVERIFDRLAVDLESGRWDEEHGGLRDQPSCEGSLRLVISEPA